MTLEGPSGWERWAYTWTARNPDLDLRLVWSRFSQGMRRHLIPCIWRVELQRRGVPHVHGVVWLPPSSSLDYVRARRWLREGWLSSIEESGESASESWAVRYRPVESHQWAVYLALHSGKAKVSQLGWKGRQWGVVGRERLSEIRPELEDFSESQRILIGRVLRSYLNGRKAARFRCSKRRLRSRTPKAWRSRECVVPGGVALDSAFIARLVDHVRGLIPF